MVLAAGIGSRMTPLSRRRPKPALPVLDEALVLRLVRGLAAQGVEAVIVNAHQHPEQVREAVAKAPIPVELSLEPRLRGSGGGLLQARQFLDGAEPFFVVNGDMCVDLDLRGLLEAHARQGASATLALRDDPRKREFGTIGYAADGLVCRITDQVEVGSEVGSGLFTGVQVVEPEIFNAMPDQLEFSIMRDVYQPLLRSGERLGSWLQPAAATWWPVGTPRELLEANLAALRRRVSRPDAIIAAEDAHIEGKVTGPAWIGPGAHIPPGARAGPAVVMGARAALPVAGRAIDALLLPGAKPRATTVLERAIAFDDEVWRDA